MSRWNHTKIFSDFGDDETEDGNSEDLDTKTFSGRRSLLNSKKSATRSKRAAGRSLPEDSFEHLDDEPLDLLDRHKTRSSLRSSDSLKRKLQSDDEPEIDCDGRLIIREDEAGPSKKYVSDSDVKSVADSNKSFNSRKGEKRRKTIDSGWAYTGSEYSSKKAGGDLKKKGKLEPYAYWPLDRKMVSRRPEHRAAAMKGMSSVVKMAKRLEGQTVANALSMKGLKMKKGKKKNQKKKHHG